MTEEPIDVVETLILTLLDADRAKTQENLRFDNGRRGGGPRRMEDQGKFLHFERMYPESMFTYELGEDGPGRLFATNHEYLLYHPKEVYKDQAEICVFIGPENVVKWFGVRKLNRAPKGAVPLGKVDAWYESHTEVFSADLRPIYQKRLLAFDALGREVLVKMRGQIVAHADGFGTLFASIIEDAIRKDVMLASLSDGLEVKFPVPLDSYKELFIIRDGPLTQAQKKRAIVHWVRKHKRVTDTSTTEVKKHTRGVEEFSIGTFKVKLTPN